MPKSPSTSPIKSPMKRTVWRNPIVALNTTPLATPNGPPIKRTEATRKYKIKAADLDTITPISRQFSHMGGSAPIQVYNEWDVAALALQLRPDKPLPEPASVAGSSSLNVVLAKKNGRRIMRTTAIAEFKLTRTQLDQLNPVSITPNAYGAFTKYYNRCDVESLKSRLDHLKTASSSSSQDYDADIFDGLSQDEAAALRKILNPCPRR